MRRVATAASSQHERDLLASHIPVYDAADDAVARVLASGTSEVARRTPTGLGPWIDLGVTGYLCVPLTDRDGVFGTMTLLSAGEHISTGTPSPWPKTSPPGPRSPRATPASTPTAPPWPATCRPASSCPTCPTCPAPRWPPTTTRPAKDSTSAATSTTSSPWRTAGGASCSATSADAAPSPPPPPPWSALVYGQLTPTSHGLDIELIRAGHTLPLHLDTNHSVHPIDPPGILLGISPHTHLTPHRLHLHPGESLVLYTDGTTEARRHDGELFGDQRLANALASAPNRPTAQTVIDTINQAVHAFADSHDIDDDQAILVLTATEPH
ncbi:SpoIIE family protein phosphatase [Streptomyces microflavus]|uniref:PP2C family protein-serine/threonine phosphatase n=1 Tax=Streptomyces microflavus TaxID=1919 RepID=UPI00381F8B78